MVTICTKKFANTREKLILSKKKSDGTSDVENFLKALKERREEGSSRVLSGTSVPNSIFKSKHNVVDSENKESTPILPVAEYSGHSSKIKMSSSSMKCLKDSKQNDEKSSVVLIQAKDKRTSSILSGTGTLEELVELKNLLHKSSYVPKQTRTRRPTIEKIRSAIEKEKQSLVDKNESTVDVVTEVSDASTSTVKKKKKKIKTSKNKVNAPNAILSTAGLRSRTNQDSKERKKGTFKKKLATGKVDVEIQCSIFKIKSE